MSTPATIATGSTRPVVELARYEPCRDLILGGPADVDGEFGADTQQAVRAYQQSKGLTVDGIVGLHTWAALLAEHTDPPTLGRGARHARVQPAALPERIQPTGPRATGNRRRLRPTDPERGPGLPTRTPSTSPPTASSATRRGHPHRRR